LGRISLKRDHQCPVCDGIEVIHVPRAVERWDSGAAYVSGLPVADVGEPQRSQPLGTYTVYVCAGCGFAEWYVSDGLDRLKLLAEVGQKGLELLSGPTRSASPYRDALGAPEPAPGAAGRCDVLVTRASTNLAFARTLCDLAGLDAKAVYALLKRLPATLLAGVSPQVAERALRRIEAAGGQGRVQRVDPGDRE
jgi:hypothetical protein